MSLAECRQNTHRITTWTRPRRILCLSSRASAVQSAICGCFDGIPAGDGRLRLSGRLFSRRDPSEPGVPAFGGVSRGATASVARLPCSRSSGLPDALPQHLRRPGNMQTPDAASGRAVPTRHRNPSSASPIAKIGSRTGTPARTRRRAPGAGQGSASATALSSDLRCPPHSAVSSLELRCPEAPDGASPLCGSAPFERSPLGPGSASQIEPSENGQRPPWPG